MIETIGTAESNRELAPGYRLLTLEFNTTVEARPGQFAMLKPHGSLEPLLRRALAVYKVIDSRRLSFLYQVLGPGTEALSRVVKGGAVEALLPLGNSWPEKIPDAQKVIVVAGGIGSASVLMFCEQLAASQRNAHIIFGARSERMAVGCGLDDFRALRLPLTVTTDDGSLGEKGFVTAPLERRLGEDSGSDLLICACGPWQMMSGVAKLSEKFNVDALVSLEAPMGCGFGVCVGCVVAVKNSGPAEYGTYKRVCTDGSIFPADTIRWEVSAMTH